MNDCATNDHLDVWLQDQFFEAFPIASVVKDDKCNVVRANREFESKFGSWRNKKCFEIYQHRNSACEDCQSLEIFHKKHKINVEENGYDSDNNYISFHKHVSPILDESNNVRYIIEVLTDITEFNQMRIINELLFDQVPCSILLIDKQFRISRVNDSLRQTLGNLEGKQCYQALKGREAICEECTASQTFRDGEVHYGHHVWYTDEGEPLHFQVITAPLRTPSRDLDHVIEMAVDVTHVLNLEDRLKAINSFLNALVTHSRHGILALDTSGEVTVMNETCRSLMGLPEDRDRVTRQELNRILPRALLDELDRDAGELSFQEIQVTDWEERKVPVRIAGQRLEVEGKKVGTALMIQDLQQIKQLEKEKLEAERLAAVGRTVAGLAHGVKNLITSLEGGMYVLNSGFQGGDLQKIQSGLEMLNRNITRISNFVQEFLSFSKGRTITVQHNDPVQIAREVVEAYVDRAKEKGIDIILEADEPIDPAPLDYTGMHECLANLVSNAVDACQISDNPDGCHVLLRIFEEGDQIIYEVHDTGCGMDHEIKQNIFTNFFSTKGTGGTGLGLLTTKKIVHEHSGTIEMDSEKDRGTFFRITLPRNRLPQPTS